MSFSRRQPWSLSTGLTMVAGCIAMTLFGAVATGYFQTRRASEILVRGEAQTQFSRIEEVLQRSEHPVQTETLEEIVRSQRHLGILDIAIVCQRGATTADG